MTNADNLNNEDGNVAVVEELVGLECYKRLAGFASCASAASAPSSADRALLRTALMAPLALKRFDTLLLNTLLGGSFDGCRMIVGSLATSVLRCRLVGWKTRKKRRMLAVWIGSLDRPSSRKLLSSKI